MDSGAVSEYVLDSIPMAANFPTVGKVIKIYMDGIYTLGNNETFTLIFRHGLGGEVIDSTKLVGVNPGPTNAPWNAEFVMTYRSVGASGTVVTCTHLDANSVGQANTPLGVVTTNTTVLNTLYVNVRRSAATAGTKVTLRQAWAETKN